MRNTPVSQQDAGLWRDLRALRRFAWFPVASLAVCIVAALAIGALVSDDAEARFRETVLVDALPPLFGPPVLPGPFDYAKLATSDTVIKTVADQHALTLDSLRPRLAAEARFNRPEIDLKVTGANALALARDWRTAFEQAAVAQSPDLERSLTQPYTRQLEEARARLRQQAQAASAAPDGDAVVIVQQELKAAQENFETASKLSQSYDVVASTLKATPITVVGPHIQSSGLGSTRGRLAAAVAIGLIVGIAGALILDYPSRRRREPIAGSLDEAPPEVRRRAQTTR